MEVGSYPKGATLVFVAQFDCGLVVQRRLCGRGCSVIQIYSKESTLSYFRKIETKQVKTYILNLAREIKIVSN